jgi:hypothetical protein
MSEAADTLRAREFVLVDDQGRDRVVIGLGESGLPGVRLFDESGRVRVAVVVEPRGPLVGLFDERGTVMAAIHANRDYPEAASYLVLADKAGQPHGLAVDEEGLPRRVRVVVGDGASGDQPGKTQPAS